MIDVTLEATKFFVDQPNNLTICLTNTGSETLTNVLFSIRLPGAIRVQSGSKQVSIPQLTSKEKFRHTIRIVPKSVGSCTVKIVNFSYRDSFGRTQRLRERSSQIAIREALPTPPKGKIEVKLDTSELPLEEWGQLNGQVLNVGQIALQSIKVRVTGRVECDKTVISLGSLLTGETTRFSLKVRPLESGTHVPILIETTFTDQVNRNYSRRISTSLRVTQKNTNEPSVSYVFKDTKFDGGFAGRDYTGDVTHNYAQKGNLAEAAAEIQQLLEQLSQTYPTQTTAEKMAVVTEAAEQIERNPRLKARVINALKAGGTEAFKEAVDHPLVNILMTTIEAFMNI